MTFKIRGNPVAQGRPKFVRRGNHVGAYDPGKSKSWKETVKWQVLEQKPEKLQGALIMAMVFHLPRPKSLPKKVIEHTKKPDLDNLVKAVKDALKGICYHDDSQIVSLRAEKVYSEITGVEITIGGV
jgi:Holliday junction resolvase RusA-like endonuclease